MIIPREVLVEILLCLDFHSLQNLLFSNLWIGTHVPNIHLMLMLRYISQVEQKMSNKQPSDYELYCPIASISFLVGRMKPFCLKRVHSIRKDDGGTEQQIVMIKRFQRHRLAMSLSLRFHHIKNNFRNIDPARYHYSPLPLSTGLQILEYGVKTVELIEDKHLLAGMPSHHFKFIAKKVMDLVVKCLYDEWKCFQHVPLNNVERRTKMLTGLTELNNCCKKLVGYTLRCYVWKRDVISVSIVLRMWKIIPNILEYEPLFKVLSHFESDFKFSTQILNSLIRTYRKDLIFDSDLEFNRFCNMFILARRMRKKSEEKEFQMLFNDMVDYWNDSQMSRDRLRTLEGIMQNITTV